MSQSVSVKVSSRHQISVPRLAREGLGLESGDRLLVDIQDGLLILIPEPHDYVARLSGLHQEVWSGVDADAYLDPEREARSESQG